jgi:hypothetical protein
LAVTKDTSDINTNKYDRTTQQVHRKKPILPTRLSGLGTEAVMASAKEVMTRKKA